MNWVRPYKTFNPLLCLSTLRKDKNPSRSSSDKEHGRRRFPQKGGETEFQGTGGGLNGTSSHIFRGLRLSNHQYHCSRNDLQRWTCTWLDRHSEAFDEWTGHPFQCKQSAGFDSMDLWFPTVTHHLYITTRSTLNHVRWSTVPKRHETKRKTDLCKGTEGV